MDITVAATPLTEATAPTVIGFVAQTDAPAAAGVAQTIDAALGGVLTDLTHDGELTGKRDETVVVHPLGRLPARRVLLTGLGKPAALTLQPLRDAAATAARRARSLAGGAVAVALTGPALDAFGAEAAAQAVVEGAVLGLYRFTHLQQPPEDAREISTLILLVPAGAVDAAQRGLERGRIIADATNVARDLQNEPGNILTPTEFAARARRLAQEPGLTCEILDADAMRSLGMGALLGVAQGSVQPPCLMVLRHKGGGSEPGVGLIGKGITFDTGGISLKTSSAMETMKQDMSGGAAVIAAVVAAARLRLPLNVTAIVPATENMPGPGAIKPSDVVRAMNGRTIEVMNTDAEGRLILADALCYANHLKLTPLIDVATLTGAIAVTLGNQAAGILSTDEALQAEIIAAGQQAGERFWPLPMWEEYDEQLKSNIADTKNVGGRGGGSITAARFLTKFAGDGPWAHLDIASVDDSDKEKGVLVKGGTGAPVRTLIQFLRHRAGQ